MKNIIVNCENIEISNNNKICLIAGSCQLETEQHAMDMSGKIKEVTSKLGINFIYKTFGSLKNLLSTKNESGRFSQPTRVQCLLVLFRGLTLRRK